MGSRACSIDRLDVAHLVTRNSRHCCWPVPKKCSRHKLQKEPQKLKKEKFLWDIRQEAFRTTCRQLFFSPQNPNNKMRSSSIELGTSGPATIINLVCGLPLWCVHYACLGTKKGKGKEWSSAKMLLRFETFLVCQEFYFIQGLRFCSLVIISKVLE